MRALMFAALVVTVAGACDRSLETTPLVEVDAGPVPYKAGGPFSVEVRANALELGSTSHATVSIVEAFAPPGAVTSQTVTLTDQGDGALAGTANLSWPPGGMRSVRVQVADYNELHAVLLETPAVTICAAGDFENTGNQLLLPLCVQTTSSDGSVALRVSGGTFADNSLTEKTAPLVPGLCPVACAATMDLVASESSFASVSIAVTDPAARMVAAMPGTMAIDHFDMPPLPSGMLALALTASPANPGPLDVVELTVHATLDGADAPGVIVGFQSLPVSPLAPSTVSTGADGRATTRVVRPSGGDLFVEARSGEARASITF